MTEPLGTRAARALEAVADHVAVSAIGLVLRLWLAWVFLEAAWPKLMQPGTFALSIATYQILPLSLINLMALVLPWLELLAALGLLLGVLTRASALCLIGMTVMFIVAIVIAIKKQIVMTSCGCFAAGAESTMKTLTYAYVWRDLGYLGAAVWVALLDDGRLGLTGLWRRLRRPHA
jgi:putative oxidoreductase